MSLKETINEKWKEAFKNKDIEKRNAYELIKQRILVAEKSGQFTLPLSDADITNLIIKECKEREDLLSVYKESDEEYQTAKNIIAEFSQYMPKQITEEEAIEIIKKLKETETNMGKLIGLSIKEIGNRYDKSKISQLVRSLF